MDVTRRRAESNEQKLCSLPDWPGICDFDILPERGLQNSGRVQSLLGGMLDESLHAQPPRAPARGKEALPPNSPLSSGGSVVLEAPRAPSDY